VLYNKYYVDELYDRILVQPIVRASRFCWRVIDAGIIDGLVNAVGWIAKGVGWGISNLQTGAVNTYAFILTVGVLIILGVSVF
jgi:NADH-quinone oxidoreductase subunit L